MMNIVNRIRVDLVPKRLVIQVFSVQNTDKICVNYIIFSTICQEEMGIFSRQQHFLSLCL